MGQLAGATGCGLEEMSMIADLKAGSDDAYDWLIARYHQPIYGLVYRLLADPSDAPDTAQEVFLKVVKGIGNFSGASSLKTWLYRIAVHEASNRRRWWFRHKRRETPLELERDCEGCGGIDCAETVADEAASPLDFVLHEELRSHLEQALKETPEPYRTTVILRDIEDLSYEQIAEVMDISPGTVKSRLARGRLALRKRLQRCARELGLKPEKVTAGFAAHANSQRLAVAAQDLSQGAVGGPGRI